jgi:RNA-directed DNA polymerase
MPTVSRNGWWLHPLAAKGRTQSGRNHKGQSTDARHRGGPARTSDEGAVMEPEQRGWAAQGSEGTNPPGKESPSNPKPKVKSFDISKRLVYRAWKKVQANAGALGVDAVGIAEFAAEEKNNLYKLWNRMSAGSYMPGPVRAVEIPKSDGGVRTLGVPNVADRVAQTAAAMLLEEKLEPIFHPDSYGYRRGRSAHDALAAARKRCWKYDWTIDLDVQKFFDSVPWDLMVKAVAHHTQERWVPLYVDRWLRAPIKSVDGTSYERERGTPQRSPISPILANLFMHYAFDMWLTREYPGCPFERYADDAVIHCATEEQATRLLAALAAGLESVGLTLHPLKTRIVYCKDSNRTKEAEHTSFDFLAYTFRSRKADGPRGLFQSFSPALSAKARKAISETVRMWHLKLWSGADLSSIAREINPVVRGWASYYGAFYSSELDFLVRRINQDAVLQSSATARRACSYPRLP